MRRMDRFKALQTFVRIAEEGSLTAAARKLDASPPAVVRGLAAYEAQGAAAIYMPLGYCDEVHRPLPSEDPRWACTVGFLGGWEPRRERLPHAIAQAGADLKVWGGYWEFLKDGR